MLITLFMGAFTIGLGITLVITGTGYLPAAEVSLLVLDESLTRFEIIGGPITLAAVITMTITGRIGRHDAPACYWPAQKLDPAKLGCGLYYTRGGTLTGFALRIRSRWNA